jgi:hypothetical protein
MPKIELSVLRCLINHELRLLTLKNLFTNHADFP